MNIRTRIGSTLLVLLVVVLFGTTSIASTDVKVMTYNVDEGTDFSAIIGVLTNPSATETDFETAVAQTISEVENTHPQQRAQLIAGEIAAAKPDLVGLQEAAIWTFGGALPDVNLQDLIVGYLYPNYEVVAVEQEFQINVTGMFVVNGVTVTSVGFTDQDVILARNGLGATEIAASGGHYSALIPLHSQFLPDTTGITRGWAAADVTLNATPFRFITTHLEDGTISPIFALVQKEQETELIGGPASTAPVIIGGDFNTIANKPSSLTFFNYLLMLASGFTDAWTTAHPLPFFGSIGATCCQGDLTIAGSQLTERIDLVFTRGNVSVEGAQLVGNHRDQIPNSNFQSWPSDHAAVESELQVGP